MNAPIVIFAFNRPEKFQRLLTSLLSNPECIESDLHIFVDGPRDARDEEAVAKVREIAGLVTGFRSVHLDLKQDNMGLAKSIINGVSQVMDEYGRAIVLEDDLVLSSSFLSYMNTMLDMFEGDERIMQIAGFGTSVAPIGSYPWDVYLNRRGESWSWACWKDRWDSVDWSASGFLDGSVREKIAFAGVGSDLPGMLAGYLSGKNSSWAVRFCYSMFKQGRYCVSPVKSFVANDGFGKDATHCNGYNRIKADLADDPICLKVPQRLEYDARIDRRANRYWNVWYRIYGKIKSLLR